MTTPDADNLPPEVLAARIYGWAYRLLQNHHDALDASQSVLLKTLTCRGPAPERPLAWLRRVTLNHCLDRLRGRRAEAAVLPGAAARACADEVGAALVRDERRARIARALAELSEAQRSVLVAKVYDEETFEQIAGSMGISASTAKTHYLRALRKLRDTLGPERGTTL